MRRHHDRNFERVLWFLEQVRLGRYPNATSIAERFEVTAKTGQRVVELARERFDANVEYSAEHRGYFYPEPQEPLPHVMLTHGEIVLILLAERLAREYGGSRVGEQIEAALLKVAGALTDRVSIALSEVAEAYSFEARATIEVDPDIFRDLEDAIRVGRRVEMRYYTQSRDAEEDRRVEPLHLRNHNGDWYLIAYDEKRNAPRVFLVGRIRSARVLEEDFAPRAGFEVAEYLSTSFEMTLGAEPIDVVLEFDAYQSRWIRERPRVHPSARLEELPDGAVRLSMRVTSLDPIRRYVLQYGSHVRVVAPDQLRRDVREEAQNLARMYYDN